MFRKLLSIMLVACISFGFAGCTKENVGKTKKPKSLTEEVSTEEIDEEPDGSYDENLKAIMGDFAFELLKNCDDGEGNVMISSASVAFALGMTANGADGDTLKAMENVLGKELNLDLINRIYNYYAGILTMDEETKIRIANSIWINDCMDLQVNSEFLTKCLTYYDAEVYTLEFDETAVKTVNQWVSDNTDGMINEIIKEFNGAELMMLINAIVFEAEWESIYYENMVWDTDFTTASGDASTVQGMYSEERTYLEDENTKGFIKNYKGNYQLVALLPDEDVDIDTYVKEFTAEKYFELLDGKQEAKVDAMLPKFQYEYSVSMVSTLKKMGMEVAFDPNNADFTNMAECDRNIYIGDVIHKTYIEMAEKGTKAAAVTAVIMDGNAMMPMEEIKEVHLDRPFMYMIIDEITKLPLFVGVVRDI